MKIRVEKLIENGSAVERYSVEVEVEEFEDEGQIPMPSDGPSERQQIIMDAVNALAILSP